MFSKLKKYIEEKNRVYSKNDLMIFIKSHNKNEKFTRDEIRPNKDYMFVGYENKDKTKVKNVLTGEVYTYNFNKDGSKYVSVNKIYDFIPSKLVSEYIFYAYTYSFEPLGTCAKNIEIGQTECIALDLFARGASTAKVSTVEKMVKYVNKLIDNNIKCEIKRNERNNAKRDKIKISDKEREF